MAVLIRGASATHVSEECEGINMNLWELEVGKKFQLVTKVYPNGDGHTFIKVEDNVNESDDRCVCVAEGTDRRVPWNPYCEVVEIT